MQIFHADIGETPTSEGLRSIVEAATRCLEQAGFVVYDSVGLPWGDGLPGHATIKLYGTPDHGGLIDFIFPVGFTILDDDDELEYLWDARVGPYVVELFVNRLRKGNALVRIVP